LAQIILILQPTKPLEKLAQHCNVFTWRWRHIWRHKMPFTDKDGHLKKTFKRKNVTLQVSCWKNMRTETGVVV